MDCSPPGSSVYGDSLGKDTGVGYMPSSRGSSWPRDQICVSYISCIGRQIFFLPLVSPGSPSSNPHQEYCTPAHPAWMSATPPPVLSSATTTLNPAFLTLLMNPAPRQPGSSGSPLPDKAAKNQGLWPLPYIGFPTNRLSSEELCTEGLLGSPLWNHPCKWAETQADPQWIATGISADPTESPGSGMAPQRHPKWGERAGLLCSHMGTRPLPSHSDPLRWSTFKGEAVPTAKDNFQWATSNQHSQQLEDGASTLGRGSRKNTLQPLTDLSLKLASVTYSCVTSVEIITVSATHWMLGVLNKRNCLDKNGSWTLMLILSLSLHPLP